MQRRDFHRWAQAQALAVALAPWQQAVAQASPDQRRWRDNPFTLGVASGQPRPDGMVLWTRLLVGPQDRADSGLDPAGVLCEIVSSADGSMARTPELQDFAARHGLKCITIADLVRYRLKHDPLVTCTAVAALPTR